MFDYVNRGCPRILVSSLMSPMAETATAASVRKSLLFIDDGIAFHPTYGDRGEKQKCATGTFFPCRI